MGAVFNALITLILVKLSLTPATGLPALGIAGLGKSKMKLLTVDCIREKELGADFYVLM